ncbi:nucleosome assembly protein family, partial [Aureobasidium melanogenum]
MAEEVPVHYEDLALLETQFDEVDREILAKQYVLSAPLYAKRQEVVSKIENFWPLVFEQSPPDVDRYITPNDANIFAKLKSLDVKRFEIPMGPEKIEGDAGDPRSIVIRFEFDENDYFTNSVLEKKFWYRRSKDGWSGLVSEPVKIDWKGEDPTAGLTDAAFAVFEERKKAGDMKKKGFAAHKKLLGLIENNNVDNTSFFAWFGYVSATRYVSAEESAQANKEYQERQDKRSKGEKIESPEPEEEDMADMSGDDEVHPEGDELAQL